MLPIIFQLVIPASLLFLGYVIGTQAEKRHYRSLKKREKDFAEIIILATKHTPAHSQNGELITGSVVIASDYFKRFVSWLIGIFGGRINVYESLLDRARREAILRLKAQAKTKGANMIVNMKFETATLNSINSQKNTMVEVLAYGSAVYFESPQNALQQPTTVQKKISNTNKQTTRS